MNLVISHFSVSGSLIGRIAETQEVINFCAGHNILPASKLIKMQDTNYSYNDMATKDVIIDT